jgi:hypothetical protein
MIRYFILHPTAANLLMGLLIIMGLVTLPTLKRETFPEIEHYEAGSRYFCESLFWASQPKQAAKT